MVLFHPYPSWFHVNAPRHPHPEVKRIKPTNPEALVATCTTWLRVFELWNLVQKVNWQTCSQLVLNWSLFYLVLWTPAAVWSDGRTEIEVTLHNKPSIWKGISASVVVSLFTSATCLLPQLLLMWFEVCQRKALFACVRTSEGRRMPGSMVIYGDILWLTICFYSWHTR